MRSRIELLLRALAVTSLALLLALGFISGERSAAGVAATGDVAPALREATRSRAVRLSARFEEAPDRVARDWLAAVRGAGVSVSWEATGVSPVAVGASAIPEPMGGVRIVSAARAGERVVLADSLGVIDTLGVPEASTAVRVRTALGSLSASSRGTTAFVQAPARASLKRVLVLGPAGWEAKFVVAALEEAGWEVDARLDVAPGVIVSQGTENLPDAAKHSAVILLDGSGVVRAPAVARYVAQGGGAILVGSATRLPALAHITPAAAGPRVAARPRAEARARVSASPLDELSALRLLNPRPDAGTLVARGGAPLVVARRADRGRVVASGLDETWKWRMRPDSGARAAHSEWWSSLVGSVASTGEEGTAQVQSLGDAAPRAALTMVLGPQPGLETSGLPRRGGRWPEVLLYGVFLASILSEVFSRRKRGLS